MTRPVVSAAQGIGCQNGQLAPCPSRPNCVCSHARSTTHAIEPLVVPETMEDPFGQLVELIEKWPRTRLITQTDNYLHAEMRTRLCRFVDDVEFYWEPESAVIHVRSASRLGYSDLGTNRRRVERIRRQLQQES